MTEEEARKQLCIGPENCGSTKGMLRYCVGSACKMAWRWIPAEREQCGYGDQQRPEGEGWYIVPRGSVSRWVRDVPPTEGYCGLAGKP